MKWKTRILSLIFLLLFASQSFANPLDHWRVRNQNYINAVTYASGTGTFVAVSGGDKGTILTSTDGKKWTERWSKAGSYFYGVAHGNNTFCRGGLGRPDSHLPRRPDLD